MDLQSFEPKFLWLVGFLALYCVWCIGCAVFGATRARSASDYFIAGRGLGTWAFVLGATATAFSGWTFLGHPGLIYRDGFQYAYASFYAITIPLAGVLFMKRQWLLGKRYGFVTAAEMFGEYFRSDAIRMLVVLVGLMFTIPFLGIQLRASGYLVSTLSDGLLPDTLVIYVLAFVMFLYVAAGGFRAIAVAEIVQCILLGAGIILLGALLLTMIGGVHQFIDGIALLADTDRNRTPEGFSHYLAVPGVMQFTRDGASAPGGPWTAMMILTYVVAIMGIATSPAFTMWAFAARSPAAFAPQQTWAMAGAAGFVLIVFSAIQGFSGHLLGGNVNMNFAGEASGLVDNRIGLLTGDADIMDLPGQQDLLVPLLMNLFGDQLPWLVGLLGICAIAAIQSTGAVFLSAFVSMLTRDVVKPYLMPHATHRVQKLLARVFTALVLIAAVHFATASQDYLVLSGGLAVALGFQMLPALIAICYAPLFTRSGILVGLIAGIVAVLATEKIGGQVAVLLGFELPWGRWPLTMHSAFWGILVNLTATSFISAVSNSQEEQSHRNTFHEFLRTHAAVPHERRGLIPFGWIAVLVWLFFAIGPGIILGNTAFGDPNRADTWLFNIPSIWAWQVLWWGLGVVMIWFLASRLALSTLPQREIRVLDEDYGDRLPELVRQRKP
ncbi:MAG: sodium:solute symporter family protein [Pseudomonadota bacterium]